jgi:hypothetical protein
MTAGLGPRYEHRARRLLRAFPRRYRESHEHELLSTLADVEGARRSPRASTAIDLVRAGWAERIRTHPPFFRWLWYRLGGKLPPEYRAWMLDDLRGRWYGTRRCLAAMAFYMTWCAVMFIPLGPLYHFPARAWIEAFFEGLISYAVLAVVVVPFFSGRMRARVLRQHGIDPTGAPLMPDRAFVPPAFPVRVATRAAPLYVPVGWGLCIGWALAALVVVVNNPGAGAIPLAISGIVFLASTSMLGYYRRSMRERTLTAQFAVMPPGNAPVVLAVLLAGLPALGATLGGPGLAGISLIVGGVGPATVTLGRYARRLEAELGRAVPSRWVHTRFAPAPPEHV